jgi:heat shock protein HtpX
MARPSDADDKPSVLESLYESMSKRQSQHLFDQVVRAESLRPTMSRTLALAIAFATLVYLILVGIGLLGIGLLVAGLSNWFALIGAAICFALVWYSMPRLPRVDGKIISRAACPTLYRIFDRVSAALNARPVDGIVLDENYNAAYSVVGWQRQQIVYIGLPLFYSLDGQERVAIIAHELAHGVNNDPARGFFLSTAFGMLARWHEVLTPDKELALGEADNLLEFAFNISNWITTIALVAFSQIPRFGAWVMIHLFWRASQRAEYLADYLATTVSGTDAMTQALNKMQRGDTHTWTLVQKIAVGSAKFNLFDELRQSINAETEPFEEDSEEARIDTTHPPTKFRVAFLSARRVAGAKIVVASTEWAQVDRELAPVQKEIQEKLAERYQRSLYY